MTFLQKFLIGILSLVAYYLFGYFVMPLAPKSAQQCYAILTFALWAGMFTALFLYAAYSTWKNRRLESALLLLLSGALCAVTVPSFIRMIGIYAHAIFNKEEANPNCPILKTEKEFKQFIAQNSSKKAVVKISTLWCPPCQQLKPVFSSVVEQLHTSVKFAQIDLEQFDKAQALNIISIPTILIFKDGKEVNRLVGFKTEEELKNEFLK